MKSNIKYIVLVLVGQVFMGANSFSFAQNLEEIYKAAIDDKNIRMSTFLSNFTLQQVIRNKYGIVAVKNIISLFDTVEDKMTCGQLEENGCYFAVSDGVYNNYPVKVYISYDPHGNSSKNFEALIKRPPMDSHQTATFAHPNGVFLNEGKWEESYYVDDFNVLDKSKPFLSLKTPCDSDDDVQLVILLSKRFVFELRDGISIRRIDRLSIKNLTTSKVRVIKLKRLESEKYRVIDKDDTRFLFHTFDAHNSVILVSYDNAFSSSAKNYMFRFDNKSTKLGGAYMKHILKYRLFNGKVE